MFVDECSFDFINGIVVLRWKFTFYEDSFVSRVPRFYKLSYYEVQVKTRSTDSKLEHDEKSQ